MLIFSKCKSAASVDYVNIWCYVNTHELMQMYMYLTVYIQELEQ